MSNKTDKAKSENKLKATNAPDEIKPSLFGGGGEKRNWGDLDAKTQASLLSLMPKQVRDRVRRGDIPSEAEVEELIKQHYDLGLVMILWQVSDEENEVTGAKEYIECRRTVKDAFMSGRHSLEKHLGPQVRQWTDLQVMTMNVPAPKGYHWEIETRRVAPKQ